MTGLIDHLLHKIKKNTGRVAVAVLLFAFPGHDLSAQQVISADTIQNEEVKVPEETGHSSVKATMYALVLPGLGQAYNKKYFKMPVVYAAFGVAGYAIWYNRNLYQQSVINYEADPTTLNMKYLKYHRKNLEISYIATVAIYGLQVIDAYVDAQLFYWDVSRDLSLEVLPSYNPVISPGIGNSGTFGLTCSFSF